MANYRSKTKMNVLNRESAVPPAWLQDMWIEGRCVAVPLIFLLGLVGCGGTQSPSDNGVKAELISITPVSGGKVKLLLKVTNVSGKDIVRAKALVDVLDAEGNSLGTKSTYLIQSGKGGLAAGDSVEEDAFIDVSDNTKAERMSFEIETVRFKK
ncbi:hypothetical protein N9189_02765 [Pirellulaceae bacterium]|nr:hypothetical protein [Pirellulaceae bacterium]